MESDNGSDLEIFHITHEVSLSLSGEGCLTALKVSRKEHENFKKLLAATSLSGGKAIRIPLNYGKGQKTPLQIKRERDTGQHHG